jgi:hypothetical protein
MLVSWERRTLPNESRERPGHQGLDWQCSGGPAAVRQEQHTGWHWQIGLLREKSQTEKKKGGKKGNVPPGRDRKKSLMRNVHLL